jgi:Tol biopolymer transport system component
MILLLLILEILHSHPASSFGPGEEPSLSPDGNRIAYQLGNVLWSVDVHDRHKVALTRISNPHFPKWSPDGSQIIFQCYAFNRSVANLFSLWIIRSDGTGLHPLFGGDSITKNDDEHPLWTRDGGSIVWTRDGRLWIVSCDGKYPRVLSKQPSRQYEYVGDFCPDGNSLLYLSNDEGSKYRICKMSITIGARMILSDPLDIFGIYCSKDGRYFSYNTGSAIIQVQADSLNHPVAIYRFPQDVEIHNCELSKDTKYIVYDDSGAERDGEIFLDKLH